MKEFRRIVAEQNFTVNEKKTRLQKRGERQEVTGLVISDRVNVAREYVRDLDNLLYIWEKHGHNAAFAKFIAHYRPKQNRHHDNPDMATVVQGKLMYLRMVKGEDSPIWRRLQKRFNRLVERKETAGGTDIIYLHSCSIEAFEKAVGCTVEFYGERTPDTPCPPPELFIVPHFTGNGHTYFVTLSKYAVTRLKHVLESGDEAQLAKFKQRFQIAECKYATPAGTTGAATSDRPKRWMIYRGMRKKRIAPLEITDLDQLLEIAALEDLPADVAVAPETTAQGLSTEETLKALVDSGFDLNILDRWIKTNKDS